MPLTDLWSRMVVISISMSPAQTLDRLGVAVAALLITKQTHRRTKKGRC